MGFEDVGKLDGQMVPQNQQMSPYDNPQSMMPYGYDAYAGRPSSNWNVQMMEMLWSCPLPEKDEADPEQIKVLLGTMLNVLPKIPNIDMTIVHRLNRRFQDIEDRSHSQGRERVTISKMYKMIFYIRSLVACGSTPLQGLTGVSAIITSKQVSEQSIRMPQQRQEPGGGLFGFIDRVRGR